MGIFWFICCALLMFFSFWVAVGACCVFFSGERRSDLWMFAVIWACLGGLLLLCMHCSGFLYKEGAAEFLLCLAAFVYGLPVVAFLWFFLVFGVLLPWLGALVDRHERFFLWVWHFVVRPVGLLFSLVMLLFIAVVVCLKIADACGW